MLKKLFFLSLILLVSLFGANKVGAQCALETDWTFNPPIPPSGAYDAGTTIEMCVDITFYDTDGANWIHAIEFVLPPMWDETSINVLNAPLACSNGGQWLYFDDLTCSGIDLGPGFYYDVNSGGPEDGNPCNNFGDPCFGAAVDWSFCFEITLDAGCGGGGNPFDGDIATPAIQVYGDGDTGSWGTGTTCAGGGDVDGPDVDFEVNCCDAEAGDEPSGPVDICGTTPFDLSTLLGAPIDAGGTWTGPVGWTPPPPGTLIAPFDPDPNVAIEGDYVYTVQGTGGCTNSATITMQFINLGPQSVSGTCDLGPQSLFDLWNNPGIILPPGGEWTDPMDAVIPGAIVDPAINMSGVYTYSYVDVNDCYTTIQMNLTFGTGAGGSAENNTINICTLDDPFLPIDSLGGSPQIGGNWIYNDTSDNLIQFYLNGDFVIDPADVGGAPMQSGYLVYNIFILSCFELFQDTLFVNVEEPFNAGVFTQATICTTDGIQDLTSLLNGSPDIDGTWTDVSGTVISNLFDPTSVTPDNTYQYYYEGGTLGTLCYAPQVLELTVLSNNTNAGIPTTVTLCDTDPFISMTDTLDGNPQPSGEWTDPFGNVVGGGFFSPGTSTPGIYTYTITSPCGTASSTLTINVTNSANAGGDGTLNICTDQTGVNLSDGLTPPFDATGFWELNGNPVLATVDGNGVTNGDVYEYIVGSGSCADTAEVTISIAPLADAGQNNTITVCETDGAFNMYDFIGETTPGTPPQVGGTWSPSGPAFIPGATPAGSYTYTIPNGTCTPSSSVLTVNVLPPPNAGVSASSLVCESLGNLDLTGELNGTPSGGGNWTDIATGSPVSNPFNLSGQCGTNLQLEYTIDNGTCAASATLDLTIQCPPDAGPDVTTTYCADNNALDLNTLLNPTADTPGTWTNTTTGAALPGGILILSLGSGGDYTYTVDGQQCADDEAIYTINLVNPIVIVADAQCTADQSSYTVTLTATGGDGNYSVVGLAPDGPFAGNTFISDPIPIGNTYSFTVIDGSSCASFLQGVTPGPNCFCPADALFGPGPISICEGGTANIELVFPSGTGPFSIEYNDGSGTISDPGPYVSGDFLSVTPAVTTTYTLTSVTDQNCTTSASDVITVNVEALPDAGPDVVESLCGSSSALNLSTVLDPAADGGGTFNDPLGSVVTTVPQTSASTGLYTYTVTGTNCPDDQAIYDLTFIDPLNVNVVSALCNSAQTAYTVIIEISGGDETYTVNGITGTLDDTVIPAVFTSDEIPTGTIYSYTISDGSSCPDVSAGPIPSPNCSCPATATFVDNSVTICEGSCADLELSLNGSGPFTVSYSDGTVTVINDGPYNDGDAINVCPSTTTMYMLTAVADQNCSTSTSSAVTVIVEEAPNAGPDVSEDFCATNAAYSLLNLVDGAVADTDGNFFDGLGAQVTGNSIALSETSSDVYTYVVEGTSCPDDVANYTISISDPISVTNVSVGCNSAQTGYTVSFDISGGDGAFIVTPGGSYSGTLTPGGTASYVSTLIPNDTDYSFTISDGSACTDQVVQGIDPDCDCPASASIVGTTAICNGSCATLTFNLGGDGPWDVVYENSSDPGNPISLTDISNGHTVTACPTETSTYTILSVNDFNCSGQVLGSPAVVTVDAPLSVSAVTETCDDIYENYQVEFTISGGVPGTYQVTPFGQPLIGGEFTSNLIPSGSPYSFTVSDNGACEDVQIDGSFQCVCITDAGSITAGQINVCEGEDFTVPVSNNEVLDANDGYQLLLHDGDETTIGSVVATSPTALFAYPEEVNFGQVYYVTAVAGNGNVFGDVDLFDDCSSQSTGVPVVFNGLPSAVISGSGTVCPGESVDLTVTLDGVGPWDFIYAIDNVDETPIFSSDNEFTISTTQPGSYTLTEVSDSNCSAPGSGVVQVSNYETPTAVLSGDGNVCENSGDGPTVELTGQAPWTIIYAVDGEEDPDPITTFSSTITIPADEDGNYTIASITDANCIGTSAGDLDVTIITAPTAMITGGGTVCAGDEAQFEVELTGEGPWSILYAIEGVPQPPLNIADDSYTFTSGIDGDYVITLVSDQSCDGEVIESQAELIVNPLPTADVLSNQDEICIGQELELIYDLQGNPPFNITYLLNEDTVTLTGITTDIFEVLQPVVPVYTEVLYVEDSSNPVCVNTPNNSKFVPVAELPDAPVLEDDTICADAGPIAIGVNAVDGLSYSWSPTSRLSDPDKANPMFEIDEFIPVVREYTYVLTASNGECSADDTLTITVDPGPRARFTFSPNPVNSEDTKVRFENRTISSDETFYFWQFDSLETSQEVHPVYEFPTGILSNYTITLTAIDMITGCTDDWSDILTIRPEMLVYVPTAFTPDSDGLNDLWGPVLSNIDENDYLLTVFDRFGQIVFQTNNVDQKWNGSMNGDNYYVKTGVYNWQIETKNPISLEDVDFKGIVTVIR